MAGKTHHGVGTNTHTLQHTREAADGGPIADFHVAGQRGVVGHRDLVAQHTVVCNVHVGHDPVVVTDTGHTRVLCGTQVEGAELADGVAVANHQLRGLTGIFLVLRHSAQGAELENPVVRTDGRVALDHAMCAHSGACAHGDMWADDRIRPHADRRVQVRALCNDGCGVDQAHVSSRPAWCTSVRLHTPPRHPRWPHL